MEGEGEREGESPHSHSLCCLSESAHVLQTLTVL